MTPDSLVIPASATRYVGIDTGTYLSAVIAAITPDDHCFVLFEVPNYRYVADQTDLLDVSVPEWAATVSERCRSVQARPHAWADPNTQFRAELKRYGLKLRANTVGPEARVAIAREYVNSGRLHLTPWLRILPYELERAVWPDEVTASGRFERLRKADHTLVCLEHILSRRPRSLPATLVPKSLRLKDRLLAQSRTRRHTAGDRHLGIH